MTFPVLTISMTTPIEKAYKHHGLFLLQTILRDKFFKFVIIKWNVKNNLDNKKFF